MELIDLQIEQNTMAKIAVLNDSLNTLQCQVEDRDKIIENLVLIIDKLKKKLLCQFMLDNGSISCKQHGGLCCFKNQ
jgi:hypothetical protein